MTANNEVGTIEPIAEIAAAVRERAPSSSDKRIPFHTDAVQAPNSLRMDLAAHDVDLLSLAAHKFRGPKGIGVLYIRRGVPFLAQQNGGGQERQRRAGTENVAGIVGDGRGAATHAAIARRRPRTHRGAAATAARRHPRAHPATQRSTATRRERLANNVSISFEGADARDLLADLDAAGIACSAGAACGATTLEPSHVLLAMGVPLERAAATLRFSLGPDTTAADIDYVLARAAGDRRAIARSARRASDRRRNPDATLLSSRA